MKKISIQLISFLIIALIIAPGTAGAVQSTSTLVAGVKGKSLTMSVPLNASLSAVDVSATDTTATATLGPIDVMDLRGKKNALGWSLSVTATNFKTTTDDLIPVTNLTAVATSYQFVKGKDGGITVPGTVKFKDTDADGISDAITLMQAAAGKGDGQFTINPILNLLVPAFTIAGDYTSTLTITLI